MRDGRKIEAGCGIGEVSRAGYGMETSSIGGMRDSFEIDSRMRDLNSKWPFIWFNKARDRGKDSESGGMAGWSQISGGMGDLKNLFWTLM